MERAICTRSTRAFFLPSYFESAILASISVPMRPFLSSYSKFHCVANMNRISKIIPSDRKSNRSLFILQFQSFDLDISKIMSIMRKGNKFFDRVLSEILV